nr:hypothetical protein Iba_chr14dCG8100 [Ipomoea batatas]
MASRAAAAQSKGGAHPAAAAGEEKERFFAPFLPATMENRWRAPGPSRTASPPGAVLWITLFCLPPVRVTPDHCDYKTSRAVAEPLAHGKCRPAAARILRWTKPLHRAKFAIRAPRAFFPAIVRCTSTAVYSELATVNLPPDAVEIHTEDLGQSSCIRGWTASSSPVLVGFLGAVVSCVPILVSHTTPTLSDWNVGGSQRRESYILATYGTPYHLGFPGSKRARPTNPNA